MSDSDLQLLTMLVFKVRVASVAQVSPAERLFRDGLLDSFTVLARREIPMPEPLAVVGPDDELPDCEALSYRCRARYRDIPTERVECITASAKAARWLGASHSVRRPRRAETTHDIACARLYLNTLATRPNVAQEWLSEAFLPPGKGFHPDAFVPPSTAIEIGGESYSGAKIERLILGSQERGWTVELW